jgi:large subunit ribosomal protein L30
MTQNTNETITIKLVKSVIGTKPEHRATLIGLGLRARIGKTSTLQKTPAVLGMIHKVRFLVEVVS